MVTVCIHQPDFVPWLGFFHKLTIADVYIVLDDVQFIRRGWHHRDRIKTSSGAQWLTIPIRKKGNFHQLIRDTEIDNDTDWRRAHLATLRANYARAPHFDVYMPLFEGAYARPHRRLIDFNMELLHMLNDALGVDIEVRFSSEMGHDPASRQSDLLVELVRLANGKAYLTGQGSTEYLDQAAFNSANIDVQWQSFTHPVYPQLHGAFIPNLSAVDALMNVGPSSASLIGGQYGSKCLSRTEGQR